MGISTRNLADLPGVPALRRLLQSLAMLDAILMPEWEYRRHSFNAHWSKGEMMGSMRDGQGDELFAVFNSHGAFLKGFAHGSPMANRRTPSDHFYRDLPPHFEEYGREPAFSPDDVTFCIWRYVDLPAWCGSKLDPAEFDYADGSASLLSMLDGSAATYRKWASEYYERNVPLRVVEAVYQHRVVTDELIAAVNPCQTKAQLNPDIAEIGYPA
jgi:hypothetical protein